jgi:VWFA-related protein
MIMDGRPGLLAPALCAFFATTLAAQQQPFRSTVEGVTIQTSVRAGNRPVGGLTARDFELRDNGVPQRITAVAAEQLPLDLTLLLDSSASVDGPTLQRLESAINDTVALLRPDDRIRLIAVSQVFQQIFDFRPKGEPLPLGGLGAQGATSLYDALGAGMMRVSEPGRRQLVIAFTDGRDSTSILDETATRQIARLSDAVVDVVVPIDKSEEPPDRPVSNYGLRQPLDSVLQSGSNVVTGSPSEMADRARDLKPWAKKDALTAILADVVGPTTGQVFTLEPKESISRAFRRILEDFRSSYVIEYAPSGVAPAGWHDVTVTVVKPGKYDVRSRKGYQGRG